jgi:iron complex outermembrane receptor protein
VIGSSLVDIATPTSGSAKYNLVLPSLNLNLDLGDGHTVRFAAGKSASRARIDSLNPGSSIKFANNASNVANPNPVQGPWSSHGGDATLRPYQDNYVDLSYEWYFARDGFISATVFYKDITNWNVLSSTLRDYHAFYIPGYHQGIDTNGNIVTPATFLGVNSTYVGGLKGRDEGAEVQATVPVGRYVPLLKGFGVTGGVAWNSGRLQGGSPIPGLSDRVWQATAFYANGGFEARVSANSRTKFLSEERGGSNTLSAIERSPTTMVDAQLSYDFNKSSFTQLKGLKVSLQGQNLTNQKDNYTDTSTGLTVRNESFGSNFLLNFTYSFF